MDKKMNISMIFWSPISGRGYKAPRIHGYLEEFKKHNVSIDFYGLPSNEEDINNYSDVLSSYHSSKICTISSSIASRIGSFFGRGSIGRYIGAQYLSYKAILNKDFLKTDVLFTQPYFWPAVKWAKKHGIPVVLEMDTAHPIDAWDVIREREKVNNIPRWKADRWNYWPYVKMVIKSVNIADKVIVFSDYAENTFLNRSFAKEKICKLRPPVTTRINLAESIPDMPKFIFVANHPTRKGFDILLEAWKKYCEKGGKGSLYICGKKSDSFKIILSRFSDLKRVEILGYVSLDKYFSSEKCVLLSISFLEGRPRTVLEAMAAGNPVIASEAGSADLVDHGKTGWKVETTVDSVHEALLNVDSEWGNINKFSLQVINKIKNSSDNDYFNSVYKIINHVA